MISRWQKAVSIGFALPCLLLAGSFSQGSTVNGRITIGTYDGIETLSQSANGEYTNDIATVSGRFFLRVADVGVNKFEFVTDVRDKNDFYGAVDAPNLQLVGANTLQFRQLSGYYPGQTFYTQVGRFPIYEAGPVFCDGGMEGYRFSKKVRMALFGGLNPKRPEQTYVGFNSDSNVMGTYLSFVKPGALWEGNSFFLDMAGVTNTVQGATDRTYWYTRANYQWAPLSHLSWTSFLDFVPNTYLQSGALDFEQSLSSRLLAAINFIQLDILEFQRIKTLGGTVRMLIPSSPYKEVSPRVRMTINPNWFFEVSYADGIRMADQLGRQEIFVNSDWLKFLSRHWDFSLGVGYRDNFISIDKFGKGHLSYFSDVWEFGLDEQFATESYKTLPNVYHPLVSELSVSRTFDNALYGSFSLQDVRDERVQISTIFLKVSYRFGSKEIPPVRDGAPPRGPL